MTVNPVPANRRRMLAVALGVETVDEAMAFFEGDCAGADIVELRLDLFRDAVDVGGLVRKCPRPLIVTNRPPREGGRSQLKDAERLRALHAAAEAGAAFVDVEWDVATPSTISRIQSTGAKAIISRHAFDRMPPELADWARAMGASGADVVKVVATASDVVQIGAVLDVLRNATLPTISIAMGIAGKASRVLALRDESCLLTFAAPTGRSGTAPGQISIAEMRQVYRAATVSPATEVFGVVGPLVQDELIASLNGRMARAGRDAVVVSFPTMRPVGPVIAAFRRLPVDGWLLTPPVGIDDLRPFVDRFAANTRLTGLVSTIVRRGPDLEGGCSDVKPEEIVGEWLGSATVAPPATSVPPWS